MHTLELAESEETKLCSIGVMLADGHMVSLAGLAVEELRQLQWEQEQLFAIRIRQLPSNSRERSLVIGQAYDTICTILAAQHTDDQPFVMGLDPRYVRLVLELLQQQVNRGFGRPRLFEVGYGSGALLKQVADQGFPIGGVEISMAMHEQAIATLGPNQTNQLLVGDLREIDPRELGEKPSLIYWNDVFEHIPPDEIAEYLSHIYRLLAPGGSLVTITPNWLLRPSDVTRLFCPLRSEARGLHLKEYRLAEVSRLLKRAGFKRIATPLAVSRKRIYLAGSGLRLAKQLVEPLIDHFPVKPAHLLCRGMGLSYTIATK